MGTFLAIIGLYGVVAFAVASRTKAIGIRMALGATKPPIVRLLLVSGIAPVVVGVTIGLVVTAIAANVLAKVLANTPVPPMANDPSTFALVTTLLVGTVTFAMSMPAWRAATGNPVDALRDD